MQPVDEHSNRTGEFVSGRVIGEGAVSSDHRIRDRDVRAGAVNDVCVRVPEYDAELAVGAGRAPR
jgi:hypothetical protein